MSDSLCLRCGKCCWDWQHRHPDTPGVKCEHLAEDMRTCLIYDRLVEMGYAECVPLMQPHQAVDLPDECGYVQAWKRIGMI